MDEAIYQQLNNYHSLSTESVSWNIKYMCDKYMFSK